MNSLINVLQILELVLTLILLSATLVCGVYAFRTFIDLMQKLREMIEQPRPAAPPSPKPLAAPEPVEEEQKPEPPAERYHCETCNAKLPETPKHSVVKDEATILVFKCRRCGKDTEVDPAKGQKK